MEALQTAIEGQKRLLRRLSIILVFIYIVLTIICDFPFVSMSLIITVPILSFEAYIHYYWKQLAIEKVDNCHWRKTFQSTLPSQRPNPRNHPHPHSAGSRRRARDIINDIARISFCTRYDYQRSNQENCLHETLIYTSDDLNKQIKCDDIPKRPMFTLVDVDYYLDMNEFLTRRANFKAPVLISTWSPRSICGTGNDRAWTFDGKHFHCKISGGKTYSHGLWNYCNDKIQTMGRDSNGELRYTDWNLDKRRLDDDTILVMFTPNATVVKRFAPFLGTILGIDKLKRLEPLVQETTAAVEYVGGKETYTSICRINSYASINVTSERLEQIITWDDCSKIGFNVSQLRTNLDDQNQDQAMPILLKYIKEREYRPPKSDIIENFVLSYVCYSKENVPDLKPSMISFMHPLIDGAYAPYNHISSDARAIYGRLLDIKNLNKPSRQQRLLAIEYVDQLLINNPIKLHPEDFDIVWEHQDRRTQRIILQQANMQLEPFKKNFINMFVKKEAYAEPKDPRIISTFKAHPKLYLSMLMYATQRWMKKFSFYSCGMTPKDIANDIARKANNCETAYNTDASRMDGRKGQMFREMELTLMLKLFSDHEELTEEVLKSTTWKLGATPKHSDLDLRYYLYCTWWSQCSGGPFTTIFNSLDMGFIYYCTFRRTGSNPDDAFKLLNNNTAICGDDAVSFNIDDNALDTVATQLGHKLKIVDAKVHGLEFLARKYSPAVFKGDNNSCIDIHRCLSKLHTCVQMSNFSPLEKLQQKLSSLHLTDPNTPIIKQLLKKYTALGGKYLSATKLHEIFNETKSVSYWSQWMQSDQYPNENNLDWMNIHIPPPQNFNATKFLKQLNSCMKLSDLLHLEACGENPLPAKQFSGVYQNPGTTIETVVRTGQDELPAKPTIPDKQTAEPLRRSANWKGKKKSKKPTARSRNRPTNKNRIAGRKTPTSKEDVGSSKRS